VIFAHALAANAREGNGIAGMVHSVDTSHHWLASTMEAFPAELRKTCDFSLTEALEIEYLGIPAFRHARVPDVVPDLVYLDGPALTRQRQVAVDILDIETRLAPDCCLIVDGRTKNTYFIRRHLTRRFRFTRNGLLFNHVFIIE
jgi:hypothetical protein